MPLPQLGRIRIDPGVSSSDSDASSALAQREIAPYIINLCDNVNYQI